MPTQPAYADFATDIEVGDPNLPDWGNLAGDAFNEIKAILGDKVDFSAVLSDPANDYWADVVIEDDGSSTATWPDRLVFNWVPLSGDPRPTSWFNEYGEFRGMPAKDNTVGFRIFAGTNATMYTARDADAEIFEVVNQRDGTRTTMFGVRKGGRLRAMGSNVGTVYTLEASEDDTDIPADLPIGTLVVRKLA